MTFSGCVSMVLDHAWMNADLPMPPPAIAPDSSRTGDILVQAGMRVSDGTFIDDSLRTWTSRPIGGYGQIQIVATPRFRWLVGGGYSSTGSVWTGPVVTFNSPETRIDMEVLAGTTYGSRRIVGHLYDSESSYNEYSDTLPIVAEGHRWMPWMQIAATIRPRQTGPWAEFRILPGLEWGSIEKFSHSKSVTSTSSSISGGWIQTFGDGSSLLLGPRVVWTENQTRPDIQMIANLQFRLPRSGD